MLSTSKCLCLVLFMAATGKCFAQKSTERTYIFKADWSAASSIDDYTYFMQSVKKSDTEYVCRYYNKFGPMVRQESYKDTGLSILNGFLCWYNGNGLLDSAGHVINDRKDGRWIYLLNDTANSYYEEYENGRFIKRGDYYRKKTDTTRAVKDTAEEDPSQKGAVFGRGWPGYVSANLRVPDRFRKNMRPGKYTVIVAFTIGKTGKPQDVYLVKSVEWSADREVFRIIEHSPDWEPAIQKGKPVLYRQKQNIVFAIED